MAGINYNKTEQVLAGHRDFSKNSVSLYGTNGLSTTPATTAISEGPHRRFDVIAVRPRSIDASDAFREMLSELGSSRAIPARPGTTSRPTTIATGTIRLAGPSDKYNFATVNLILTPQERTGLFLNGNYKLTDNVEVYASVMHNKTSSAFQLAPDPLTDTRRPGFRPTATTTRSASTIVPAKATFLLAW